MRTIVLLIAAALLTGCSAIHNAQQAAASSYHQSFRTQFKESFMKSCTAQVATEDVCGCVDRNLEKSHTDQELIALSGNDDKTTADLKAAAVGCTGKK
jgi:uncharacterized protein YceK